MTAYFDQLKEAMGGLAGDPRTMFIGQAVEYPGTAMFKTLEYVPKQQRLELPVAEDMQLGMAIGMSLNGFIPICLYPRVNFLLLAMNQLVLHLDKIPIYSDYRPHVIIRTAVATDKPLDPGPQHLGDFTQALKMMLKTVQVIELKQHSDIVTIYRMLLEQSGSYLVIERLEKY